MFDTDTQALLREIFAMDLGEAEQGLVSRFLRSGAVQVVRIPYHREEFVFNSNLLEETLPKHEPARSRPWIRPAYQRAAKTIRPCHVRW